MQFVCKRIKRVNLISNLKVLRANWELNVVLGTTEGGGEKISRIILMF